MSKQKEKPAEIYVRDINPRSSQVKTRLTNAFYLAYAITLNRGQPLPKIKGETMEPRAFIRKWFKNNNYDVNEMMGLLEQNASIFVKGMIVAIRSGYEKGFAGTGGSTAIKPPTFGGVTGEEDLAALSRELMRAIGVSDKGTLTAFEDAQIASGRLPITFKVGTHTSEGETFPVVDYAWPSWIMGKGQKEKPKEIAGAVPRRRKG